MNGTAGHHSQAGMWKSLRRILLPDREAGRAALRCGAEWRRLGTGLGARRDPVAQKVRAIIQANRDR
ncbi:hypothetical protein ACFY05_37435 [Microtetraspora fusca]|uniref:Uncharacterized protein n=1 Tax=Microtetraspora fusca TaxID=1997 RepID=A0ABW6VHX0_MICFU